MNKCCASQDGICRNSILFGTKCDGYKERCTLRPASPQLAISAYHVLQQYCTGQPVNCKGCGFYEHCPECFQGIPCDWNLNEEGEINEVKEGNTD